MQTGTGHDGRFIAVSQHLLDDGRSPLLMRGVVRLVYEFALLNYLLMWTPWDDWPLPVITVAGAAQPERYISNHEN